MKWLKKLFTPSKCDNIIDEKTCSERQKGSSFKYTCCKCYIEAHK